MANIFILWSGPWGQTRRIVQAIEQETRKAGHELQVVDADNPPRGWIFSKANAIVVVAALEGDHYSAKLRSVLKQQAARLAATPSAFLSVSLPAAVPEKQELARARMAALQEEVGWQPALQLSAAAALRYPEYSFFLRRKLKRWARELGLPTDTSRTYEFTDWEQVQAFAGQLIDLAAGAPQHA